jgi:chemotaxis protein methyltransferase CheR
LLRPGGHLFLGHSESLLGLRVGLRYVANTVYRKPAASDDETEVQP